MSRYIDADEVEKRIDIVLGLAPKAWDKKALKELKMYVVHAVPTADVRENVMGEWEEYRDWKHGSFKHRCSECGYHDNERDDLGTYNYCPHCGADMRPITALSKNAEIDSNLKRGEA